MFSLRFMRLVERHLGSFCRHNTYEKFMNLCSVYYHQLRTLSVVKAHPFEIIIDPTNICNLRCPLCVTGQHKNRREFGKIPVEDYKSVVGELGKWLYKIRFYSWGEPMLHEEIHEMISYAAANNIGTELSSNLQRFSKGGPEGLVESGLELLIVSLDGASEETYREYRRGGDFGTVVENIRKVVAQKKEKQSRFPQIEVQFLVMKHNEHEIEAMKQLTKDLDVDRLMFVPVIVNTRNKEQIEKWLPDNEKWRRYNPETFDDRIFCKRKRCAWLWRSAVLNWDGTVSPCCVFEGPKTEMGSLKTESFDEIWNGPMYQSARKLFKKNNDENTPVTICTGCRGVPHAADEQQQGLY